MNATLDVSNHTPTALVGVPAQSVRILVVDDHADIRDLLSAILEHDGYCVDSARDGESAWRVLRGNEYNLLVTDYIMPRMSGLALVRQMRVASMALPGVMVSGNLDALDTEKLARDPWSRVDAFVRKPFSIRELLRAVHSALMPKIAGHLTHGFAPA